MRGSNRLSVELTNGTILSMDYNTKKERSAVITKLQDAIKENHCLGFGTHGVLNPLHIVRYKYGDIKK